MIRVARLFRDCSGAAAAEMMLIAPFLFVLTFGAFELGYYFLSEHVVDKAVRDAARYAARLPLTNYPDCTSVDSTAEQDIQRLARTGDPSGTNPRLMGWTADNMTTVSISCPGTGTYANAGIYTDFPDGAPVVTVSATVPYQTVLGMLGLGTGTLTLHASQQAAVVGA
jgi:Flp pilus assembly protein TadG